MGMAHHHSITDSPIPTHRQYARGQAENLQEKLSAIACHRVDPSYFEEGNCRAGATSAEGTGQRGMVWGPPSQSQPSSPQHHSRETVVSDFSEESDDTPQLRRNPPPRRGNGVPAVLEGKVDVGDDPGQQTIMVPMVVKQAGRQ